MPGTMHVPRASVQKQGSSGSPDRFKPHHACSPQCLARAKKCACGRGGCAFDWCSLNATTARAMVGGEPCCTRAVQVFNCHLQANCHVWGCLPCWPPVGGGPWTCLQGLAAAEFSIQNTIPCIDEPLFTQSTAKLHAFQAGFELAWLLLLSRRAGALTVACPAFAEKTSKRL